jgi:hypothetical protein
MNENQTPNIDDELEAWGAAEPSFQPIDRYSGGDAFFRTSESPPRVFLGRREGTTFLRFGDPSSTVWDGAEPFEFCIVPRSLAALARDL